MERTRATRGMQVAAKGLPELEVLLQGVFEKRRLLDLVRNFTVFEVDGPTINRKLAGYHQFHAVNKVIVVSATESDRAYLLASSEFLLDPRRLTVALSRAKRKMVLVAARSIFSLFSPDEDVFMNSLLWRNLLLRTCSTLLWEGERGGKKVAVWGGKARSGTGEARRSTVDMGSTGSTPGGR